MSEVEQDFREASTWLATALTGSGYDADFTIGSLRELDRFVDDNTDEAHQVTGLLAVDTGPRMWAMGAYTGEVVRQHFGAGVWCVDEDSPTSERDTRLSLPDGSVIWPMARAVARVVRGSEESLHAFVAVVCGSTGSSPGGDD